ncbi:hypothetical protein [Nocardioides lianchengensis]|uniref:Uncharacterized protein n=1 Tax=Nocardioides lianchengensis TaxID=1045774 RepID=A0A1G6R7J6_9ACTN|nr:hypothetical protein [Nocardioides lianchengensis]NYG10352.1 hypothetical protein [Nocardioides lianchengensis]SDD00065.1 hypothetical protein SAMN05421872_105166 [Nocardioides lianchengensis]
MTSSRFTYANVASTLALVLVLGGGGTAVAAGALAKNSVGSKQIRAGAVKNPDLARNAVTATKVKNDSLTGADVQESTLAEVPSAAFATTAGRAGNVHGAVVRSNGVLVTGQSLNAVSSARTGTGLYQVVFATDITDCAAVASMTTPGVGIFNFPGEVLTTGLEANGSGLYVKTFDSAGAAADRSFAVAVVC